jgi:hypothetical protein
VVIVLPEDAPLIMAYACSCLSLCSISKLYSSATRDAQKHHPPKLLRVGLMGSMVILCMMARLKIMSDDKYSNTYDKCRCSFWGTSNYYFLFNELMDQSIN